MNDDTAIRQLGVYLFPLKLLFLVTVLLHVGICVAESYRIATYNVLNFPDALGSQRLDDLRTAISYIDPDIIVIQEMQSQSGVDLFRDSVVLQVNSAFANTPFHDGPGTDNALYYREDRVDYLSSQYLATSNRDIAEYRLMFVDTQQELYVFSVHFKASQGASNEAIRLQEATVLRNRLDTFAPGTEFMVLGDFNIYSSDEPAFQKMIDSLGNNRGRLFDPLNVLGPWHENINYASVHSQSTRLEQLPDGGAGGGLDDRFDLILCSEDLFDSTGLLLLTDSYTVCGNDGEHFNLSINYGYNGAVPSHVANALYYASDHLPIFVDISDETEPLVEKPVVKVYPNPMQDWAQIAFPWHEGFVKGRLTLTNILGQRVHESEAMDPLGTRIDRGNLPIGVYFIHILIETRYGTHKYHTSIAIVN